MAAVDFSEFSHKIVEYACRLATDLCTEILFVNVINQRDIDALKKSSLLADISVKGCIEDCKDNRKVKMNGLLKEINCSNIPYRFVIKKGTPFLELIEATREEGVDLVVIGSKGRSNISGFLTGSQANKMFRHCPVPLISIREKNE